MVFNGECLVADGLPRKDGSMGPGSPLFIRAVFVKLETYLEVFFFQTKKQVVENYWFSKSPKGSGCGISCKWAVSWLINGG